MIFDLYYCRACHYIFPAAPLPDRCPDCGKEIFGADSAVRPTNEKKMAEYQRCKESLLKKLKFRKLLDIALHSGYNTDVGIAHIFRKKVNYPCSCHKNF